MSTHPLRRRLLIASAAAVAAPAWLSPAIAQPKPLRPTPSQTEGPFYPVTLPADSDADLLRNGKAVYSKGQPTWVDGTVTDLAGVPVAGAVVESGSATTKAATTTPATAARPTRRSRASARSRWAAMGATASAPSNPCPTPAARRTST